MDKIPHDLIHSLRKLGLLESEAKMYVTLVTMSHAEVKELTDLLGFSKPSTYESLRSLEERGLVVLINEKPMTYQAVPADIGLEMLTDTYIKAKEDAKERLSTLDRSQVIGQVTSQPPDSLWFVFNKKSIEYKISDMLRKAERTVFAVASDQYVKYFMPLAIANLDTDLIVFSENPRTERSLKKAFKSARASVQVVSISELVGVLSKLDSFYQKEFMRPLEETLLILNFDNILFLIVDDAEILSTPPLPGSSMIAFNLRNKHAIANMRLKYQDVHRT